MERRDRACLLATAQAVLKELRHRRSNALALKSTLKLESTYSDGYSITLGRIRDQRGGRIQIWLDRFTGPDNRRLNYCFSAANAKRIKEIANAGASVIEEPLHRGSRDIRENTLGVVSMATPLAREEFGRPIVEIYEDSALAIFYGVYVERAPEGKEPSAKLVRQMATFFTKVAEAARAAEGHGKSRSAAASMEEQRAAAAAAESQRQGIRISPALRKALENHGMRRARRELAERYPGWEIEDVHTYRPYDFQCSRGRQRLYVEVKCTQSRGTGVFLTRREVEFATRERARMALVIVSGVKVGGTARAPRVTGGSVRFLHPWNVEQGNLTPMAYSYDVPPVVRKRRAG